MVEWLNAIPGVYTFTSCRGGKTYGPYVTAYYPKSAQRKILQKFTIGERGTNWATLHPKPLWWHTGEGTHHG